MALSFNNPTTTFSTLGILAIKFLTIIIFFQPSSKEASREKNKQTQERRKKKPSKENKPKPSSITLRDREPKNIAR